MRNETIRVKGQPDRDARVRIARHGPVISDVSRAAGAATPKGYVIAIAWTALARRRPDSRCGRARMPRAANGTSFLDGARDFHSPQQNMVYADVDGNIGFIAAGRVPMRRAANDLKGMAPAPGWDARYDWAGFIPFDELPRAFNPPTAARSSPPTTRSRRPATRISSAATGSRRIAPTASRSCSTRQPKHSARDPSRACRPTIARALARELLPIMLRARAAQAARAGELAAMLAHWDGSMDAGRPEPLIFGAWYRELTRRVYADELGPELFKDYWDQRAVFMTNVLSHADDGEGVSRWCDDVGTPQRESCADQIAAALEDASVYLRAHYGGDPKQWRWGTPHFSFSRHQPFTKNALLAPMFDLRQPSDGDSFTVNVGPLPDRRRGQSLCEHPRREPARHLRPRRSRPVGVHPFDGPVRQPAFALVRRVRAALVARRVRADDDPAKRHPARRDRNAAARSGVAGRHAVSKGRAIPTARTFG